VKLQVSGRMMGSFFISARSEIIFDHLASVHDKPLDNCLSFGTYFEVFLYSSGSAGRGPRCLPLMGLCG
jgi:hypothetical protein